MDLGLSLRLKNNFAAGTGGVVESWWLSGGVSASDCLAAYQSIGADSYAASKVNLANPGTYDITDGASYPTWNAATGWTFDGIDDYLDTNVPGMNTDNTLIVYISNFSSPNQDSRYIMSVTDDDWNTDTSISFTYVISMGVDLINDFVDLTSFLNIDMWYVVYGSVISALTPYVLGVSISGAYRNGILKLFDSSTNASLGYGPLRNYILGAVWGGSAYEGFTNIDILAAAIYNTTLTNGQVSAITTALQAL